MSAGSPVTYRMLHEASAGMGLCVEFFRARGINPDAPVKCNCKWDGGHEAHCDIVAAHELIAKQNAQRERPVSAPVEIGPRSEGAARLCPKCGNREHADRCSICRDEPRLVQEVPCPNCYGGHFRPCQWCGDSGVAHLLPPNATGPATEGRS